MRSTLILALTLILAQAQHVTVIRDNNVTRIVLDNKQLILDGNISSSKLFQCDGILDNKISTNIDLYRFNSCVKG